MPPYSTVLRTAPRARWGVNGRPQWRAFYEEDQTIIDREPYEKNAWFVEKREQFCLNTNAARQVT